MSLCMGKPTKCLGENKGVDQLRGYREADHCLCFRYMDRAIPLLLKYKISSLKPSSVTVQACLVSDLVGIQIAGFLAHRLK